MSENRTVRKMGLRERADVFLSRNYRILIVFVILVVFLMSILLPLLTYINFKADSVNEVNPSIVNGILTVTAIVFGFIVFELREIKASMLERFLLSFPLLLFLMVTVEAYFIAVISGKINTGLVLIVTSNCLFNIFYSAPLVIVKETREEIERKKTDSQ
jgi:hypothetical protein